MLKISEEKHISILSITIILVTFSFLSSILALVIFTDILEPLPTFRLPQLASRGLFFFSIFLCSVAVLTIKKLLDPLEKLTNVQVVIILFFTSVILSLPFIILTEIDPISDFARYYNHAVELYQNGSVDPSMYLASFPHIIIFSAILSIIFRIFAPTILIAQLTGTVFSSLSVVFVYLIGQKLVNKQYAFFSALLWLFMPTRILYPLLISTENVFNAFSLFAVLLFFKAIHTYRLKLSITYFCTAGVLFSFLSALRPNGLIIFIACLLLFLFFLRHDDTVMSLYKPIHKYLISLTIIGIYFLSTLTINFAVEKIINMETSSDLFGWSFFIGMNKDSNGHWNYEDNRFFRELLEEKGPEYTLNIVIPMGFERLNNLIDNQELISFLYRKTASMWYANRDAYDLLAQSQNRNSDQKLSFIQNQNLIITISDGFYYVVLLLALFSLGRAIKEKDWHSLTILSCLVILGTIASHIPFEVQMRYKNHALIWLGFLAAEFSLPKLRFFKRTQDES